MAALNPNQFSGAAKPAGSGVALNATRGAALGGIAAGVPGAIAGGAAGAAQSLPAVRTAERNVGNIATGGVKGAASGVKSAAKTFGPIGSIATGGLPEAVGGAAGALRGAAASPAGRNIIQGAESGAKSAMKNFGWAGPIAGAVGGIAGGINGLFRDRSAKPSTPTSPAAPKAATTPAAGGAYTVKKGDTLSGIASANNTTVDALRKANPAFTAPGSKYNNGNMIWSGTKVNMPGASAAPAAPSNQQMKINTPKPAGGAGVGAIGSIGSMVSGMGKSSAPSVPNRAPAANFNSKISQMPFETGPGAQAPKIQNAPFTPGNKPNIQAI
jgi:LysM repeat protein